MLFSEPKIPQSVVRAYHALDDAAVSVLFSEPKIPQWALREFVGIELPCFSALQRAENSSICDGALCDV